MPQVLKVEPHQTLTQMSRWLAESPAPFIHKRRLAVKLAAKGQQRAADIAIEVDADVCTVRAWIRKYNEGGPAALDSDRRGGRYNCLVSQQEEDKFVAGCRQDAEAGRVMTGQQIRRKAVKELGIDPSPPWVYLMLDRHEWRKIAPRPSHVKGNPEAREEFKKNSTKQSPSIAKQRQK
jgi:transposase